MFVVPRKPTEFPSTVKSGAISTRNAIWAVTADPTRRERARPMIAPGMPPCG